MPKQTLIYISYYSYNPSIHIHIHTLYISIFIDYFKELCVSLLFQKEILSHVFTAVALKLRIFLEKLKTVLLSLKEPVEKNLRSGIV